MRPDSLGRPAIVFDLDGTLIDSLPDVIGAMNRVLAEEGFPPVTESDGRNMIGDGARAMVQRAFAAAGMVVDGQRLAELTRRYVADYEVTAVNETRIFEGVVGVLDEFLAADIGMGVCTNKPDTLSRIILEQLGLAKYFKAMVGGDVLPVKKPDPAHVFAVLKEIGATASTAAFVGDSPTDMVAARNAGLPPVAVTYGYSRVPSETLDADMLIEDFSALPDAIASLVPAWPVGPSTGS